LLEDPHAAAQLRELLLVVAAQTLALTGVDIDLLTPVAQRLRRDAKRLGDISDRAARADWKDPVVRSTDCEGRVVVALGTLEA
jgi:hypothetical protein